MLRVLVSVAIVVAIEAMTTVTEPPTTTTAMPAMILYDMKHHKAMIVKMDGCYEYHMNHQDVLDHAIDTSRAAMEARMLQELSTAINIQETGHHHIDHMTTEIKTACAAVPVYSWEVPTAP